MQRIEYETDNNEYFNPIEAELRRAVTQIVTRNHSLLIGDLWSAQIKLKDSNGTFFNVIYGGHPEISKEAKGKMTLLDNLPINFTGINENNTVYYLCETILNREGFNAEEVSDECIHELLQTDMFCDLSEAMHQKILATYGYYFRDGGIKVPCYIIDGSGQENQRTIEVVFHKANATPLDTFYVLIIFKALQSCLSNHESGNSYRYDIDPLRENHILNFFIEKMGITEA